MSDGPSQEFLDRMSATCRPPGIDAWCVAVSEQATAIVTAQRCEHATMVGRADESEPNGHVYVAQPIAGGLVKIGRAVDVAWRLRSIQACCPLPLAVLAIGYGAADLETYWHRKFWKQRVHGEWFDASIAAYFVDATARAGDGCARCVLLGDRTGTWRDAPPKHRPSSALARFYATTG